MLVHMRRDRGQRERLRRGSPHRAPVMAADTAVFADQRSARRRGVTDDDPIVVRQCMISYVRFFGGHLATPPWEALRALAHRFHARRAGHLASWPLQGDHRWSVMRGAWVARNSRAEDAMKRVGFVGLRFMGGPMAECLSARCPWWWRRSASVCTRDWISQRWCRSSGRASVIPGSPRTGSSRSCSCSSFCKTPRRPSR